MPYDLSIFDVEEEPTDQSYDLSIFDRKDEEEKPQVYDLSAFDIPDHPEGEAVRPTGLAAGPLGFEPPTQGHRPVPQAERRIELPSGPQSLAYEKTPRASTPGGVPGIDVPAGPMTMPQGFQGSVAQPQIQPADLQAVTGGGDVDWTGLSEALTPSNAVGGRDMADKMTESKDVGTWLRGYFYKAADLVTDAAKFPTVDMAAFVNQIADVSKEVVENQNTEPLEKLAHDMIYDIEKVGIVAESPFMQMLKKIAPESVPVKIVEWLDRKAIRLTIDNYEKAKQELEQERKTHAFWQYIGRPVVASSVIKGVGKKAGKIDTAIKKPKEYTASESQMQLLRDVAKELELEERLVMDYADKVGVHEAFRRVTNPEYSDIWRRAAEQMRNPKAPTEMTYEGAPGEKVKLGEVAGTADITRSIEDKTSPKWRQRRQKAKEAEAAPRAAQTFEQIPDEQGIPSEVFEKKPEVGHAEEVGGGIEAGGAKEGTEGGRLQSVRLRRAKENRVEAEAGEVAPTEEVAQEPKAGTKEPWGMTEREWLASPEGQKRLAEATKEVIADELKTTEITLKKRGITGQDRLTIEAARQKAKSGKLEGFAERRAELIALGTIDKAGRYGVIEEALREGKPVPAEVLKDYPDLAAKYKPETVTPETPQIKLEAKAGIEPLTPKPLSPPKAGVKEPAKIVEPRKTEVKTEAAEGIWKMPIDEAITDAERFQISRPNEEPFSERTASSVAAAERETAGSVKEPITVWKDPTNGQWHVLDGFSRMEGFRRAGRKDANFQEFKGTEKQAIDYAIMKNKQQSAPGFAGDLKSYKVAQKQDWTQKRIKETYGTEANLLDAATSLDPAGKFIEVLSQEVLQKDAPYVKRFGQWVGELRKHYGDKLTNRHEKQIFDFLYNVKKFEPLVKDNFFDLIEKQVSRIDWKPTEPLILKREGIPKVGAAATQNTASIVRQIDELKQLKKDTEKFARENPKSQEAKTAVQTVGDIQKRIDFLSEAVKDIQERQGDIFATMEATATPESGMMDFIDKQEAAAKKRVNDRMEALGRTTFDIGEASRQALLNLADLAVIGAAKIARGTMQFARWAREMKREFGKNIEPHLEHIYRESIKRLDETARELKADGFKKDPVKAAARVNDKAIQASTITGELVKEATEIRNRIAINIGTDPIAAAKYAMTEHHVRIRQPEYVTKKLKEAVDEAVPNKDRQMLVIHAYEQRRAPQFWDKLTPKEKDVVRWFEQEIDRIEGFIATHQIKPKWETDLWKKDDYNYVAHWWINPKTGTPYRTKYGRTIPASPHDIPREFLTWEMGMTDDLLVEFPKLQTLDPLEQYKIPNLMEYKKPKGKEGFIERKGVRVWIKDMPEYRTAIKELGGNIIDTKPGMKPASTNIGEIFGETWESRMRQFYSREMYENLSKLEAGIPMEIEVSTTNQKRLPRMIEKWHDVDNAGLRDEYVMVRDHRWQQAMTIERVGKRRKKITYEPVAIHKDLYPFVRAYMESPTYGKWADMMFTAKALKLGFSFFHHVSLGMQELANGRIPFKNVKRGLRLVREGDEVMRLLHKHGLEIKGYEDINYGDLFRFHGDKLRHKIGNAVIAPLEASSKFLFEVVQPGMKASFAWDEFHKQWPKAQKKGISKEQLAREVVKEADSFFSGEDYKRALLESNAWMAKYYFSATSRKVWQMGMISPTWQREHLIAFKRSVQSLLPKGVSEKMGLEDMSPIMRRRYQKYVAGAATMFTIANLYNYMQTKRQDGEGKFMWQNPNMWSIRMPWQTPAYKYADAAGREHIVPARPAYIRPFKSIIEVPEFILGHGFAKDEETDKHTVTSVASGIVDNMFRKFSYKLTPMIGASMAIMERPYGETFNLPRDASKWAIEVASPIVSTQVWEAGVGTALGKIVGADVPKTKKWSEVMAAFFGMPPSTVRVTEYKNMYYELIAQAYVEKDRGHVKLLRREYETLFGQEIGEAKLNKYIDKLKKMAGQ